MICLCGCGREFEQIQGKKARSYYDDTCRQRAKRNRDKPAQIVTSVEKDAPHPHPRYRPLPERFWEKVEKTEGCWLWTATKITSGSPYGMIGVGKTNKLAHRVSYEMAYGAIPDGMNVLHQCDNPSCVRPDHLFLGTQKENAQDMVRKGRQRGGINTEDQWGEKNSQAKLTESQVEEIRQRYTEGTFQELLAREYGVSVTAISQIVNYKRWNKKETKPVLKYPGSKWAIAPWIISHFPVHTHYIEPYCGSAAVFFSKEPSRHEVLNDLNGSIVNKFTMMRTRCDELAQAIMLSPWSESEYHAIEKQVVVDDPVEHARRFLVRSWQAHGGTISQISGWKHNGVKATVYPVQLWQKLPARLMAAAARLQDAELRNRPALEVINYYNQPDCLLYIDPPYELSTRSRKYYKYELAQSDHVELLEALTAHRGMIVLSGYAHALYDEMLADWMRVETPALTEHGNVRREVLWINPLAASRLENRQISLFGEEVS